MEHIPRFDSKRNAYLSKLANSSLLHCVKNSPLSKQIIIGRHQLESFGVGKTYQRRYGNILSGKHNGIHLSGPSGCHDLAENMINILKDSLGTKSHEWITQKRASYVPTVPSHPDQIITRNVSHSHGSK